MNFIDEIAEKNRFVDIALSLMYEKYSEDDLIIRKLSDLLFEYSRFYSLSPDNISEKYMFFLKEYKNDVKYFIENDVYYKGPIDRQQYDIALIISAILTEHRRKIMKELLSINNKEKMCIIGVGPGVELSIISPDKADIYDTALPDFTRQYFSKKGLSLNKKEFVKEKIYSNIFAIELLEHISDLDRLLKDIRDSLNEEGFFYTTYAFNVPQRDHLTNLNEKKIEEIFSDIGFEIHKRIYIEHETLVKELKPYNIFYHMKVR